MSDTIRIPRLPPRPEMDWREDGVPRARAVDDVYYSTSSGLAETEEVFFRACGLPERWKGRTNFTVAELGFGTGLNMAALARLWCDDNAISNARLHCVSVEGRLMRAEDARRALAGWSEQLGEPLQALLAQWPERARGVQRIRLADNVWLTLIQDEVLPALQNADFRADAWFLDGFAPSKNPDMWSPEVLQEVSRLSASGAPVGTYTVAGAVRRGLADAGFAVEKKPGFGRKRERLEAVMGGADNTSLQADPYLTHHAPEQPKSVIVVGAGVAGACAAHAFRERGADVTVLSHEVGLDQGTSANPLALMMPRLDAADTPASRAIIDAYLAARRLWRRVGGDGWAIDIEQPARDDADRKRFAKLMADPPLDEALLDFTDGGEGLKHLNGVAVRPVEARARLLAGVEVRWSSDIRALDAGAVTLSDGSRLEADLVVLAAGLGISTLSDDKTALPIAGRAGQLEWMEGSSLAGVNHARAGGQYVVASESQMVFGATFTPWPESSPPAASQDARQANLDGLASLDPAMRALVDPASLTSRTGVRATTPDRLPFAGWLPDPSAYANAYGDDLAMGRTLKRPEQSVSCPGVMAIGGLGARGFMWAPLLAEICAAFAFGEPKPTGRASLEALSPARFLMRDLKRRR